MQDENDAFVIQAGRIVGAQPSWDGPGSVLVADGRIEAVEPQLTERTLRTFQFPRAVCLPGLIDLHAHPAPGDSVFGIDPDQHMLPFGVTSVLSQGDVGADGIAEYAALHGFPRVADLTGALDPA